MRLAITRVIFVLKLVVCRLGVPVVNSSSGYPLGKFKCVAAVDISQQGAPCDSCGWLEPAAGKVA